MTLGDRMKATRKARRAQSSIEYIMMLSAVSIIIVVALTMMVQLKGTATGQFFNGSNTMAQQLSSQLNNLSATVK